MTDPVVASEATPLLGGDGAGAQAKGRPNWLRRALHVENRILLAGFLVTLAFSYTQVPLFYVFHLMECDVFYDSHPPFNGSGDRCSRDEIAAGTATQFSLLGITTTLCGTLNLFVAGWTVKKVGPRLALAVQTFVPALRVAAQIIGVLAGKSTGMLIIQATQIITIIGGPAGYILIVNIIAGEVVEPARRTAVFGMLQGCIMLGQGLGFCVGGMIGDAFGISRPFEVAFCNFLIATLYVLVAMPYISPDSMSDAKKPGGRSLSNFFAPLRLLAPQRLRLESGAIRKHYGVLFLCTGVFLGVVATGYVPLLIQMYATAAFNFNQSDNGWLMSEFAFVQSAFLIFIFPRIIGLGRRWFNAREPSHAATNGSSTNGHAAANGSAHANGVEPTMQDEIPVDPEVFDAPAGTQTVEEPVILKPAEDNRPACAFDLFFLRWSLVLDGLLTTIAAFATQRWHIYLAAFLLPFASGSAPAAKGVVTEMCTPSQRADILNALTLVENFARLSTLGLFGFVFSALADIGKSHLTFICNAAVAMIAASVLLMSRFPPPRSKVIETEEIEEAPIVG